VHRDLLTGVMKNGAAGKPVSSEQRLVLRQICSSPERTRSEPEDFLIAFKLAVVDAANEAGIPPGPERNDFLARLVSAYIEEFYRYPAAMDSVAKSGNQELAAGGA
jgi:hypothetical protein